MPQFKIQCDYSRKKKMKFFNDQGLKEYHGFLVDYPETIPDEYLCSAENKRQKSLWIWIIDDLVKGAGIDFGNLHGKVTEYKFVVNLGGEKTAKFSTNNRNWMVLKTKDYFENTIKKIGFRDSENYFYELKKDRQKPNKNQNNNPTQSENKTDWGKIAIFCLPIVMFALFSFLLIKWVSKKKE